MGIKIPKITICLLHIIILVQAKEQGFCSFENSGLSCVHVTSIPTNLNHSEISQVDLGKGGNILKTLKPSNFAHFSNLEFLSLKNCHVQSIESGAFLDLQNLTQLWLENNELENLNPNVFQGLQKLWQLSLDNNPLGKIDEFPELLNLEEVWLNNCSLSEIGTVFKNLKSLRKLFLSRNSLTALDDQVFRFLPNLESLYLDENKITTLDAKIFSNLHNLHTLYLSHNPLQHFTSDFNNPNLENFQIQSCHLLELQPSLFKNLVKLSHLDLSSNNLTTLDWRLLSPLKALEYVSLRDNPWECDCHVGLLLKTIQENKIEIDDVKCSPNHPLAWQRWREIPSEEFVCAAKIVNFGVNETSKNLFCEYSGYPPPEILWMKDGQLFKNGSKPSKEKFPFEFKTELKDTKTEGIYSCLVSNKAGYDEKSTDLNSIQKPNQTISFFEEPFHKKFLYEAKVYPGNCQILPYIARGTVKSVAASTCIVLFQTANCEENRSPTFKINPGQGRLLPSFENSAKSFQDCESYQNKSFDKVKYYGLKEDGETHLEQVVFKIPIEPVCKNLPVGARSNVSTMDVSHCLVLFAEENCKGLNYIHRPHSGIKLDDKFNWKIVSFQKCEKGFDEIEFTKDLQGPSLQFYRNKNHTGLLYDAEIKSSCTTPPEEIWGEVTSMKSDSCVVLFTRQLCQGYRTELHPGSELDSDFENRIASFMACPDVYNTAEIKNSSKTEDLNKPSDRDWEQLETTLKHFCSFGGDANSHKLCQYLN